MAHEIETMTYVGEVPWHGLGKRVEKEMTSEVAIVKAGLNWDVGMRSVFAGWKQDNGQFNHQLASDYQAIVRESDNKVLGVVGDRYHPIQNSQAFDFFDAVVGGGKAIYHTAGSLKGGKLVWILAKLPNPIVVSKNDVIEKYVLLSNSHDGSRALRMMETPVRVVCANTLNMALGDHTQGLAIRHTRNSMDKVQEAQRVLGFASSYYEQFADKVQELVKAKFSDKQMTVLADALFKKAKADNKADNEEMSTRSSNNHAKVIELFTQGKGQTGAVRGTAWAAYNAVTEFVDHHRSTRSTNGSAQEARVESIWMGSGKALKQNALNQIDEILQAA